MTAGFMVPIYRFSDGWTWCRVGRAAFSGENPPRDDRLRRSLAMLSQDDIKLFLFSHASRPKEPQRPLFFLLDPNFKIMEAFDCSPDRVLDGQTLQVPSHHESRPMSRYLAFLEDLGVPFENLMGPPHLSPWSRGWSLFSALQVVQGEPVILTFSEFEAWWAAKVEPVESVFDLSMFKLLGVRSPYLLPDDEFIAWVQALGTTEDFVAWVGALEAP